MPTTPTHVCNLALGRLGEKRIMDMDEETTAGRACKLHFETARDSVMRSHRWNFAQKRVTLTKLVAAPAFGWENQFTLPADCLRVLEVNDSEFEVHRGNRWEIEGRVLLSNEDSVELVYTARTTDTTLWDPLFVEALATYLAARLSETMRGDTTRTAELLEEFARMTGPVARRVDANETNRRRGRIDLNSPVIAARRRGV
jgi:hypothetical protein